jgi:L-ascorbate metabolism protein UlaG (beta-lactamase superfamily)
MKITKLAHSCLLIEEKGLRVLADPGGIYFTVPDDLGNIDVILITHEHLDHFDQEALMKILRKNPDLMIFTNSGVGKLLSRASIQYLLLEDGASTSEKGVSIQAFGKKHAVILQGLPLVDNTGYLISNRLFVPGDALTTPPVPIEILALPVAGPWLKLSESVQYATSVKPRLTFPVHEAIMKEPMASEVTSWPQKSIEAFGTRFVNIEAGRTIEV